VHIKSLHVIIIYTSIVNYLLTPTYERQPDSTRLQHSVICIIIIIIIIIIISNELD